MLELHDLPPLTWLAAWRGINVALCLGVGGLIHWRLWTLRKHWNPDEKSLLIGTLLCVFAMMVASLEAYYQELPFGIRIPAITMALVFLLDAMIEKPLRARGAPVHPLPIAWKKVQR